MATAHLPNYNFRPIHDRFGTFRRFKPTGISIFLPQQSRKVSLGVKTERNIKWAVVKQSLAAEQSQQPTSTVDVEKLVDFLYEDLPHLFDEQGIDRAPYDEKVEFRDPITKYDTVSGYLFNIRLLKQLFEPDFQLHWAKQDYWDSIKENAYFSWEGLLDVIKQLRIYKTPDLESPKYQILKRTATYEVRKYDPFIVVESNSDKLAGSTGFNDVAGYISGKNSKEEKIPMTTPVFTQAFHADMSKIAIQVVIPADKDMSSLPDPTNEEISLRKVEGGIAAVSKFSGKPTEDIVRDVRREITLIQS